MRAALTAGDSITVDRLMSTVSPFGTGMSSNSLRCTRGGVDAQAVAARRQSEMARTRRMASTSCASSYSRRGRPTKFLAGVLVISLLAGCASTNVPPMGYQGQPYRPAADERQLWSDAEREEEKLAKLGKSWDDPLLEEYLSSVAAKLVPEEARQAGAPAVRIVVLKDPTLNAFTMPNGKVYVHTGLLSRLQNESQLAMILGHEVTHVTNRHALKFNRDPRNKHFFFGNHPRLDERIVNTRELLETHPPPPDAGVLAANVEDFALRTRTVVRENAALDIRAGRFELAKAQLDRVLRLAPKDPTTHLY